MRLIYRNRKNQKLYIRLTRTKIDINSVWVAGVIYMCLYFNKEGMIWTRTEDNFEEKFYDVFDRHGKFYGRHHVHNNKLFYFILIVCSIFAISLIAWGLNKIGK